MAAIELATGYVSLAVETSDVAKQVGRMFTGVEGSASKAGKSMGAAMAKGFNASAPDVEALAADVERTQKKITAQAEASARKQEAAARKVEIAQAKVNETTEKYGSKSSQALTATDRLATAQQKLESETMAAADAQRKLERDLEGAEKALKDAESSSKKSSEGYAKGWKGVGQRVKGYLTKGVKGATDDAEKVAERGGRESAGKFGTAFKGAVAGVLATVGIREIGQGIGTAITGAGEMEQSVGAIDSVFKGSAKQMHQWSADASSAVGLSANEFNELGTLIGAQLKNGGTAMDELAPKTNNLIGLGADLSSMFGGSTADAVGALSSALKGERDPIEKYGVSLNQAKIDAEAAALGFEKVGGSLSAEANQAATLSLIMKQTTDAHGNFAAESDTFAHKQQVAAAQWEDLTSKIGELFLPVASKVMGYLADTAMPIVERMVEGVRIFGDAWSGSSDKLKASGFEGFMARLGQSARGAFDYFQSTVLPVLQDLARFAWDNRAAIAAFIGAFAVFKTVSFVVGLVNGIKLAFLGLNAAMRANPIGIVVTLIAALVAGLVWAYNNVEWFRDGVNAAWAGIQAAVSFAWNSVIKPVFNALVGFVRDVLGPIFSWLWQNVIKPVFGWIGNFISTAWNHVIWPVFSAIADTVGGVLGPIFKWLWNDIIKPVWGGISRTIGDIWNNNIKPVFKAVGDFIGDKVVPVFKKGVDGIKAAWEKIQEFAKGPIEFVINTVINDGLIAALNTVRGWFGMEAVEKVSIPGFAVGGYTGDGGKYQPAGVVHAGEFVVRKEATAKLAKTVGMDGLEYMNQTGRMPGFFGGGYVSPVSGPMTSRFGEPRGRYRHAGVDYAVPIGRIVKAALDGVVERVGTNIVNGRSGKGMLVGHEGGKKTYYGHLNSFIAAAGQRVRAGEGIAKSGNTGNSTGPHLHFETWLNGKAVNPLTGGGGLDTGDGAGGGFDLFGGLNDLIGSLGGKFREAFPAGGAFVDMIAGAGKGMINWGLEWVGKKAAEMGDFLSPTAGGIFDINKGTKDQVKAVANGYGWGGGEQWNALHEIINRESSWNLNAANPNSSARGLFQKMTSAHGPVEKTAGDQAGWGLHYIKSRYGNPLNALAHHNRKGWYADGGLVRPFLHDQGGWHQPGTYSYNGLSKPEAVLTPDEASAFKRLAAAAAATESGNSDVVSGIDYDRLADSLVDALDGVAVQMDSRNLVGALKNSRAGRGGS